MLNIKSFLEHLPKVGDTLTVVGQRNRDEIKGTATVIDVKLNDEKDYEVRGSSIDNVATATVRLNDTKILKGKEFESIETVTNSSDVNIKKDKDNKAKNNKKKQKDDMIDKSQISTIEDAVKNMQPEVKVVKKDRGLIERTESSKIIITEDNRQVLND